MRRITPFLPLLFIAFSACTEEPCPTGQTRIGAACVDNFPDSGIADANTMDSNVADTPAIDTGNDAMIDACMPSAETCNGVSDDCDDIVDEGSCDFPNTSATCEPGGCVVSACDEGFLDCSEGMGCETASDRNNCGACGTVCGATEGCEAGVCVEHTLDWWWTVDGMAGEWLRLASGLDQQYLLAHVSPAGTFFTPSSGAPFTVGSDGLGGALVVAVDERGRALWQVRISGAVEVVAIRSIPGVDGVFVAGNFRGTMVVDGPGTDLTRESPGARDAFVLRIDLAGDVRLVHHITDLPGNDHHQEIHAMDVNATGGVFVAGTSLGDFRQRNGLPSGLSEVPSGRFSFILGREAIATPTVGVTWENLVVDDENVYVSKRIEENGVIELGGEEYFGTTEYGEPLIACFDQNLALQWVQTPLETGGGETDEYHYLHAGEGQVVIGHQFAQPHQFGGQMVAAGGFVASLSRVDGTVSWVRELGDTAPAVAIARGQVLFGGSAWGGTIDLGGGSLGNAIGPDVVFGAYDADGNYQFARRFGGLGWDIATDLQPTSTGMLVTGTAEAMSVDGVTFDSQRFVMHFSE